MNHIVDIRGRGNHTLLTLLISVNFLVITDDPLTIIVSRIHHRVERRFRGLRNDLKKAIRSLDSGRNQAANNHSNARIGAEVERHQTNRASRIERVASYIDAVFKRFRATGIE